MPAGTGVAPWSVSFVLGASRALAAVTLLDAILHLQIWDQVLATGQGKRLLQSLKYVYATYTVSPEGKELAIRSLLAKMRGSERQRPDVLQLARTFEAMASLAQASNPNSTWDELLSNAIRDYNARSLVSAIRCAGSEALAVKFVAAQGPEFRELLARCWREVKTKDGPVTVSLLASPWLRQPPRADDPLWREILTPTPAKLQQWLLRVIKAWRARVARAQATTGKDLASTVASKPAQRACFVAVWAVYFAAF